MKGQGEEVNGEQKLVMVVDGALERAEDDEGEVVVAAACGGGREIGPGVGVRKEDHELRVDTADAGDENHTVAAAGYWQLGAAVGHTPREKLLHRAASP